MDVSWQTTLLAYFCCFVSVVFFGSNYVVVKKFPTGDGLFFQFALSVGIFLTSIFLEFVTNPTHVFYPFAMIGGMIWAFGNLMTVPIIRMIGISLGISLWGITNLAMGWFTGTFGLFGLNPQTVANQPLNIVGACFACLSVPFYGFIKSNVSGTKPAEVKEEKKSVEVVKEKENLIPKDTEVAIETAEIEKKGEPLKETKEGNIFDFLDTMNPLARRLCGIVLALCAGLFFGSNFTPPQYMIDNGLGPVEQYSYIFSHACGIMITSIVFIICYAIITLDSPVMYPQTFLPAIVSGIMWEIAQVAFMFSNTYLPWSITFSINAAGPGLVSTLWGILAFAEIRGWRNYLLFGGGVVFLLSGVLCVVFSR
ncbi:transmembrane protein R144.6, putative [Entamoeba invadens IP1]|uniref:Transmembrane protein R144.6, putative n=1 Tax=Entamoeba invadens IP1 TaxID=370355 RepID=A0A0A1U2Q6_ENTIV|nr:transmembrane protein R144.6, putative [Entamoeba invadens IP1]ELP86943.1 transmembrane protein R144.6, putative [Entamoeba invadens IP1]|eukprot:XP_004253714.1 transmembrane protein R144.6, putative [Entamoeba invadens IP1]